MRHTCCLDGEHEWIMTKSKPAPTLIVWEHVVFRGACCIGGVRVRQCLRKETLGRSERVTPSPNMSHLLPLLLFYVNLASTSLA